MRRSDFAARLLVAASAALLLTGCAHAVTGTAVPGELDVRTLETGPYASHPLPVPDHPPDRMGAAITESVRMAEAAVEPTDVDPSLTHYFEVEPQPIPGMLAGIVAQSAVPVLEKHRMLAAFTVGGADREWRANRPDGTSRSFMAALVRFPDDTSARQAAAEIDAADFAVSNENVAVMVPDYAAAHGHWRPNVATMAASIAHGQFVVTVYATEFRPDSAALTKLISAAFAAQLPLLDTFAATAATPADQLLTGLKTTDPDGMVQRALPTERDQFPGADVQQQNGGSNAGQNSGNYILSGVVFGPRGTRLRELDGPRLRQLYIDAGIDRLALVRNGTMLLRARDAAALGPFVEAAFGHVDNPADPPPHVPGATCGRNKGTVGEYFLCIIVYRRYVARVYSGDLQDAHEKAAAQYALLVNAG